MAPIGSRLAMASDHERDQFASIVADDGGAENPPAGRDDHLDHAGGQTLGLGAVVLDEREAQHAHAGAVTAAGVGLAETDARQAPDR